MRRTGRRLPHAAAGPARGAGGGGAGDGEEEATFEGGLIILFFCFFVFFFQIIHAWAGFFPDVISHFFVVFTLDPYFIARIFESCPNHKRICMRGDSSAGLFFAG